MAPKALTTCKKLLQMHRLPHRTAFTQARERPELFRQRLTVNEDAGARERELALHCNVGAEFGRRGFHRVYLLRFFSVRIGSNQVQVGSKLGSDWVQSFKV